MITGDKVVLRAVEPSDIHDLWKWSQDEETMRLRDYPSPPMPLEHFRRDYEESIGCTGFLRLAICDENGVLIGETSLRNIDERSGQADFTIAIGDKNYWGRGYGSDATRVLMRYGFRQLNLHRITLYVHTFNDRAIRAYEKSGFKREGIMREAHYMDGSFSDVLMMGLLRQDFELLERQRAEEAGRKTPVAA